MVGERNCVHPMKKVGDRGGELSLASAHDPTRLLRSLPDRRGSLSYRKAKGLHPRREPSGRLSRSHRGRDRCGQPGCCRRLRDAALQKHADPLWGTEIGRLFLCHKLTAAQFEAAKRWQRLASNTVTPLALRLPTRGRARSAAIGMVNGYGLGDDPPVDTEGRPAAARAALAHHRRDGSRPCRPGGAGAVLQALRHTVEQSTGRRSGLPAWKTSSLGLDVLGRLWGLSK